MTGHCDIESARLKSGARPWVRLFVTALFVVWLRGVSAQTPSPQPASSVTIRGRVVNSAGMPVAGALVHLEAQSGGKKADSVADPNGLVAFSGLPTGTYTLTAEKSGIRTRGSTLNALAPGDQPQLELRLEIPAKPSGSDAAAQSMEFADNPTFTVAGVTDWTAAGGHGSDAILRTSEGLTRDTLNLKPDGSTSATKKRSSDANLERANQYRLAGEKDERLGNPLAAVREYEEAVRLDPSEMNYFAWGSELLFHRAVWQAKDVFEQGVKAYPTSSRLLTALGSALFAGALYDEAARRLCEASDLNPNDPEPYMFMGKVEIAAPNPLPCVPEKLARYLQLEPEAPLANYFYAMAIWKQHAPLDPEMTQKVQGLLTKAVTLDPKCGDAYLQLGNLESTQRKYPAAIDFYEKAIKANPQLSEAHYRLAMAYDRAGDQAKAHQEFQLHDEIEKRQAEEVERQRREVKQFVVTSSEKPVNSQVQ